MFADTVSSIVGAGGLNILINNAGVVHRQAGLENLHDDAILDAFKINALAPLMLSKVL